jgi:myo-inositol-1(or 4)-monophosphatase
MIEIAKDAAYSAGKIILSSWGGRHSVERKGGSDNIVTEADVASERKILQILQKHFPGHNFISEEAGEIDNGSDYTWVIDPLDGTGPYFSGLPLFGVSIGLLKGQEPLLGVLDFPALGNLYWAEKGRGAFKNGRELHVSSNSQLKEVMVGFDFAWMDMRDKEVDTLIRPIVTKARYTPILGCTIAGMAYVAEGAYGGYIHWAYNWDYVAGVAILEEVGGKVTDNRGEKINWLDKTMTVVASNGLIHEKLLSLLR